jgi:hypothetical protein
MRTVASLAAAASLAVAVSGAPECGCSGTCSVADLQIIDFGGQKWLETPKTKPSFVLYKQGDFSVIADTLGHNWIHKLTFGHQSVTLDDCVTYGGLVRWTHEFKADKTGLKATLDVDVFCYGTHGPKDGRPPFMLNVELKMRNNDPSGGKMTFFEVEEARHSTGACVGAGKGSSRLLVAAEAGPKATCDCSEKCSLRDSQHLKSFNGHDELVELSGTHTDILYTDGPLSKKGTLFIRLDTETDVDPDATYFFQTLSVKRQGDKYDLNLWEASLCDKGGHHSSYEMPARGGSVTVDVTCKLHNRRSLYNRWHLDVKVTKKVDAGKGSFPDQERTIGASGLCTNTSAEPSAKPSAKPTKK